MTQGSRNIGVSEEWAYEVWRFMYDQLIDDGAN